ncbi:ABC transporter permease [Candidatus Woesearchaeota archaeon]|nr:ABC transporter permease [Candidatus Woesearchaeota archaeon]
MTLIKEYFQIALRSLTRRRLRSWLTMIGIFIGIAAVVSLISLGQGMRSAVYDTFERMGSDKLMITPKTQFGPPGANTGYVPLVESDLDFLEGISGVQAVSGYVMSSARIEFQDSVRYYSVVGIPTEPERLNLIIDIFATDIAKGRNLEPGDTFAAVTGFYHNERGLYAGKNIQLNNKFFINDQKFYLAGVFEPIGSSQDDSMIIIPMDSFRKVTGIEDRIDFIVVQGDEETLNDLADVVTRSLARHQGVNVDDVGFNVQTPEDLLSTLDTILNIVQGVLIGIALISLFVGGIGVMNTMFTSVMERNKEIGIMKAVGAKNSDILYLFLIESGLLGLVGGLIGIFLGVGFAKLVEIISTQALGKTFLVAHFSWGLFLGALAFSFVLGAGAGTLPAVQAAKHKPADTLRDE